MGSMPNTLPIESPLAAAAVSEARNLNSYLLTTSESEQRRNRHCDGEEVAAARPNLEEHVVGPQSERIQDAPVERQSGGGRAIKQPAHPAGWPSG